MELEIHPQYNPDPAAAFKTQWRAYFKKGLGAPTIVYGATMDIAMRNALAHFRKNTCILENWPIDKIVEYVEPLNV